MQKICSLCHKSKPLDDFHKKSGGLLGRRESCKNCRSSRKSREWDSGTRTCKSCGETKNNDDFPQSQHGNPRGVCRRCKARYENYGLNKEAVDGLVTGQHGLCAVCERDLGDRFAIDHDHSCCPGVRTCGLCVRGVLCIPCNSKLDWYIRNTNSIIHYLEKNDR